MCNSATGPHRSCRRHTSPTGWARCTSKRSSARRSPRCPTREQLPGALPDVRPTTWGAVPRVWEKFKAAIEFAAANEPDETKRMGLQWGLGGRREEGRGSCCREPGARRCRCRVGAGRRAGAVEAAGEARARRAAVGGSGAAPIPKETLAFFLGLGIPIAEVWGMSELSCIATVSSSVGYQAGHGRQAPARAWKAGSPRTASSWFAARW